MTNSSFQSARVARYVATLAGGGLFVTAPAMGDIIVFDGPISVQGPAQSTPDLLYVEVYTGNIVTGPNLGDSPVFGLNHYYWTSSTTYSVDFGFEGLAGGNAGRFEFVKPSLDQLDTLRLGLGEAVGTSAQFWSIGSGGDNLISTTSGRINAGIENGWYSRGTGFVGFRFDSAGTTLHGWAQLTLGGDTEGFTLDRWAFDDSGATILTGQVPAPGPVGIALLAMGAAGMRRSRQGSAA